MGQPIVEPLPLFFFVSKEYIISPIHKIKVKLMAKLLLRLCDHVITLLLILRKKKQKGI